MAALLNDTAILYSARHYVSIDPNPETRAMISQLMEANNTIELDKCLGKRMAFGTAGLRGAMGAGYNRMNDLVILQTTQGVAAYLLSQFGEEAKTKGVVIGYDHRRLGSLSSLGFARMSAAVLLSQGFKVYLLEGFVPTPFVAYAVKHLSTAAGIMVTASHNPPLDNGFKLYYNNGSQIIPPHDAGIAQAIVDNLMPWQPQFDTEGVLTHPLASDVTTRIADSYYTTLPPLCSVGSALAVTYTAMHGVGARWIDRAFTVVGHASVLSVPSQRDPDPTFPTVAFPNPEEKGALDQAMAYAEQQGSNLIIANDPDADRLAAAERQSSTSPWYVFSGNELGVLLAHWVIMQWKQKDKPSGVLGKPAQAAVLTTVVSSRMLKAIAEAEDVCYCETLTGFKWLGNKSSELTANGTTVLFSYEEALGYCVGDAVADKDGISAAVVFVHMASELRRLHNRSVLDHLRHLYGIYGQFVSYNGYVISHDSAVTDKIFARLRCGKDGTSKQVQQSLDIPSHILPSVVVYNTDRSASLHCFFLVYSLIV